MKGKKIWFKGFSSRLWIPVSIKGWTVTGLFFIGIFLINKINNFPNDASLTISQILLVVLEFAVLLTALYFLSRGHVDKRY